MDPSILAVMAGSSQKVGLEAAVVIGTNAYPYLEAYGWSDVSGFRPKLAQVDIPFATSVTALAINAIDNAIAVGITPPVGDVYIEFHLWSQNGFGGKIGANGFSFGIITSAPRAIAWSPDNAAIVFGHANSPYLSAFQWNQASYNLGPKFTDPLGIPGTVGAVTFSPNGNVIIACDNVSPYIHAYSWSSGFGSKYSPPSLGLPGVPTAVSFSPNGDAIAVSHNTSPYVSVYAWSDVSGFGTKYIPTNPPTGWGRGVAFSPNGNSIVVGHSNDPFITGYQWNNPGFGTKFEPPSPLPSTGYFTSFSPSGDALAIGHAVDPYVSAFPWSDASGFGSKYSDPVAATGTALKLIFPSF